jgi:hypothetical protein
MGKVTESVRDAVEDYYKLYFDSPKVAYMSEFTLDALKMECAKYLNVWDMGGVEKIFGMEIVKKDYLPMGVVIVGGVLCDAFERWENK